MDIFDTILTAAATGSRRSNTRAESARRVKDRLERQAWKLEERRRLRAIATERRNVYGRDRSIGGYPITEAEYTAVKSDLGAAGRRLTAADMERAGYVVINGRWQSYEGAADALDYLGEAHG